MRLRVLGLICVVVALLSGLALFSNARARGGNAWLDGVFLVAISVALLTVLIALTRIAGRSIVSRVDEDRLRSVPERELTRRRGPRRPRNLGED